MSLREFLLDYAEKAPKAKRISFGPGAMLRFMGSGGLPCCPLFLVGRGLDTLAEACMVIGAADLKGRSEDPARRAWRSILEKLAEPEPEVRA